jgi:hypothetical protein
MATPPSPNSTKTIRVSIETHKRLMDLADRLEGSADDAMNHLLGSSTVRVPVSDIQHKRWSEAAHEAGVGLAEFVKMRVEGALHYGADPAGLQQIYHQVTAIARHVGMRRRAVDPSTKMPVTPSSPVHTTSTERHP